ncbi:hypothetical protein ACNKHQ_22470 [Shigella flexneri]
MTLIVEERDGAELALYAQIAQKAGNGGLVPVPVIRARSSVPAGPAASGRFPAAARALPRLIVGAGRGCCEEDYAKSPSLPIIDIATI